MTRLVVVVDAAVLPVTLGAAVVSANISITDLRNKAYNIQKKWQHLKIVIL